MKTSTLLKTSTSNLHAALAGMVADYETFRDRTAVRAVEQEHPDFMDPYDVEAEERSIAYSSVLEYLKPLTESTLRARGLRALMEDVAMKLNASFDADNSKITVTDTIHMTAAAELRRVAFTPTRRGA